MFTVEQTIPWEELEEQIRRVPLLEPGPNGVVYPYENADISLCDISYDEVRPTSLYALRSNLATQVTIGEDIRKYGYHPLELAGGLILGSQDIDKRTGFIPPIVEVTENEGAYILDGLHRTAVGRWMGRTSFRGVMISNMRLDCPAYAYPNSWQEVRIVEEVPANPSEKKRYREGDYRKLYRDFGRLNGSRLREV